MKDFLNKDINLGDMVLYSKSSRNGGLSGPFEICYLPEKLTSKKVGILKKHKYSNIVKPSYVDNKRLVVVSKLLP